MGGFQSLLIILLTALLLLRIYSVDGLNYYQGDPELESLSEGFVPLRDFLSDKIDASLPQPQAALLAGIVLGVKTSLPPELKQALRRTSTIHIVVVSGQNLSLLAGFLMQLGVILGRRKATLLCFSVIILYPLLTGLQTPVIRAAIMAGFTLAAQFLGREKDVFWVLLLTAFLMLIYNPNWIFSISFQLSFLATFGVSVMAPVVVKKLQFLPNIIKEDFGVSLSAHAMTWPVIAANFHQASLVGIAVNSIVLWTISLIMAGGIISLLGVALNPVLGGILALFPAVLLTFFIIIVNWFNTFPFASIYVGNVNWVVWLGYYIFILGIFVYLKKINQEPTGTNVL